MIKQWWIILVVVFSLLLSACGGDDIGSSSNNTSTTTTQNQPGNQDFSVTISGDYENTIPPGTSQVWFYPDPDRYELFFGQMSHNVFIVVRSDAGTGTYSLESYDGMMTDQIAAAEVGTMVDPDNIAAGAESFNEEISGTITLTEIGDTVSGGFEFTAVYTDIDDNNQETRKSVSVTGEFSDLTVLREEE